MARAWSTQPDHRDRKVQADRERHERRQAPQRRDVDTRPEAGDDPHDYGGEHRGGEQCESERLGGEAPISGVGAMVEPGLVGEQQGHALRIGGDPPLVLRSRPRNRCGFPRMLESSVVELETLDEGRLAALLEAGRGLVAQLEVDAVLEELLRVACDLTGARYAAIGVLDEDRRQLERFVTRGIDRPDREAIGDLPRGHGILGELIRHPAPLRLEDVSDHPRSYGFPAHHPPMSTFLGVPVLIRGEPWGNLYLTEKAGGPFDEADEAATIILADWAALAVDNARLYEDAARRRAEAERAVRRLEATAAIARAVGSETDLERVLELIVKRGRALLDARSVVLLLVDGDQFQLAAGAGQVASAAIGGRFSIAESATGEVLFSGRPERIDDVPSRLRISERNLGVAGATTALLVPLVYRNTPLGLLAAFDRFAGDPAFGDEEERLFLAFAASAATAVATARTVAEERLRHSIASAEQERRRWARELHDETLQGLGGLQVLLSSALRRGDTEALELSVREAIDYIGTEIESLRTLITELRPAALDEIGLAPAIDSLGKRLAAVEGLEVDLDVEVGGRLDPEIETTVYRIVQEALTNVAKHAHAECVRIRVALDFDTVRVEVTDDGRGFDPDARVAGFGLVGMRERVALANGQLDVESEAGRSVVRAVLPVGAAAAAG
jgi:signal transduction histidine kinase